MALLWEHGAMSVRAMLDYYAEPKPHFNTVSTTVRILEEKGYVAHSAQGGAYEYYATVPASDFRRQSLSEVVRNYFSDSYKLAVSALVEDEKISVDELRELIAMVESRKDSK